MKQFMMAFSLLVLFALPTQAQEEEMLSIDKANAVTQPQELGGKSAVVFVARTSELTITTNNPNDNQQPKAVKNSNGEFEYTFTMDLSSSKERKFTIQRSGTTYKTSLTNKGLKPNQHVSYRVDGLAAWQAYLKLTDQRTGKEAHLVQNEACLEFMTELSNLEIVPNKNLKFKIERSKSPSGANIISVIIDTKALKELKEKNTKAYSELLASTVKIYGEGTNELQVPKEDIEALGSNVKIPYAIEPAIKTAFKKATYDELLTEAREYWLTYTGQTNSNFYDAARLAYDAVLEHSDCPQDMRDQLWAERNKMAEMRQLTYFRETAVKRAKEAEAKSGFNDPEVYKWLSAAYKFSSQLVERYPEVAGFQPLKEEADANMQKHPNAKETVKEEVTMQRQTVKGTVSFKSEYKKRPLNSLHVYASPTSEIDRKRSKLIGSVNADGSFSVIMPDGMSYIFVDGEKDDAHSVKGLSTISIVIK